MLERVYLQVVVRSLQMRFYHLYEIHDGTCRPIRLRQSTRWERGRIICSDALRTAGWSVALSPALSIAVCKIVFAHIGP